VIIRVMEAAVITDSRANTRCGSTRCAVFINCNRNTDPFRAERRHSKNGRPLYIVRCHKIILRDGVPSITRLNERSLCAAATRTLRVRSDNKRCARLRSKVKFLASKLRVAARVYPAQGKSKGRSNLQPAWPRHAGYPFHALRVLIAELIQPVM